MSLNNLEIVDISEDSAILICDADRNDVCELHHDAYSTSHFPYVEATRLAHLIVNADDLCNTLESLVDSLCADRDARKQYASQIAAAEAVLRRAYGATA